MEVDCIWRGGWDVMFYIFWAGNIFASNIFNWFDSLLNEKRRQSHLCYTKHVEVPPETQDIAQGLNDQEYPCYIIDTVFPGSTETENSRDLRMFFFFFTGYHRKKLKPSLREAEIKKSMWREYFLSHFYSSHVKIWLHTWQSCLHLQWEQSANVEHPSGFYGTESRLCPNPAGGKDLIGRSCKVVESSWALWKKAHDSGVVP